jgi:3-oxoacyl-[acyl-carrier protein] reductase
MAETGSDAPPRGDELAGKVALVTGASRNIGRAIARSLAAGGASVMITANSSKDAANEAVAQIEGEGGVAAWHLADVSDPEAVDAMVEETISRFGRLDFLINNHTLRDQVPFEEMSYERWRHVVSVILDGAFLTCRSAVPHIIEAGSGAIVNISGQHGISGSHRGAHVGAAKMGLIGLTKALAQDLAQYGISVNCVAPGLINTELKSGGLAHSQARTPLGRLGTMAEVAALVRMLCGPQIRYVTGQTIHVNGGGLMP